MIGRILLPAAIAIAILTAVSPAFGAKLYRDPWSARCVLTRGLD